MIDFQSFLVAISIFIVIFLLLRANDNIKTSNIGEIGSFLAGIMSPIAILWVIYGQFSQSSYIKQNSEYIAQQIKENKQKEEPILHIFSRHLSDSEINNFNDYYENLFLPNHYGDIRTIGGENNIILNEVIKDYEKIKNEITRYSTIEMVLTNSGGNAYNISIENKNLSHVAIYKPENKNLLNNETKKIKIKIPLGYYFLNHKRKIHFLLNLEDIYGNRKKYKIEFFIDKEHQEISSSIYNIIREHWGNSEATDYIINEMRKSSSNNTRAETLDFDVTLIDGHE